MVERWVFKEQHYLFSFHSPPIFGQSLWLSHLQFYEAKTVGQYLPLSPGVQEAQEALVHPTQENHTTLQSNSHSVTVSEKSMASVPRRMLAVCIDTVSFQELGEIIQLSQLLIQNWLTLLQIFLPVHCSLASLPEGKKEK